MTLKQLLIRVYTAYQTTFLYRFRAAGTNVRLDRRLFVLSRRVSIGSNVYIGRDAFLDGDIEIGSFVMLASYVAIVGGDHRFDIPGVPMIETGREHWKRTTIGNDVWIGHGAIVMNGVTIGDCAIVGAGSVVTDDVPAGTIVAGNPARAVRARFSADMLKRHRERLLSRIAGK